MLEDNNAQRHLAYSLLSRQRRPLLLQPYRYSPLCSSIVSGTQALRYSLLLLLQLVAPY